MFVYHLECNYLCGVVVRKIADDATKESHWQKKIKSLPFGIKIKKIKMTNKYRINWKLINSGCKLDLWIFIFNSMLKFINTSYYTVDQSLGCSRVRVGKKSFLLYSLSDRVWNSDSEYVNEFFWKSTVFEKIDFFGEKSIFLKTVLRCHSDVVWFSLQRSIFEFF